MATCGFCGRSFLVRHDPTEGVQRIVRELLAVDRNQNGIPDALEGAPAIVPPHVSPPRPPQRTAPAQNVTYIALAVGAVAALGAMAGILAILTSAPRRSSRTSSVTAPTTLPGIAADKILRAATGEVFVQRSTAQGRAELAMLDGTAGRPIATAWASSGTLERELSDLFVLGGRVVVVSPRAISFLDGRAGTEVLPSFLPGTAFYGACISPEGHLVLSPSSTATEIRIDPSTGRRAAGSKGRCTAVDHTHAPGFTRVFTPPKINDQNCAAAVRGPSGTYHDCTALDGTAVRRLFALDPSGKPRWSAVLTTGNDLRYDASGATLLVRSPWAPRELVAIDDTSGATLWKQTEVEDAAAQKGSEAVLLLTKRRLTRVAARTGQPLP